MANGPYTKPHRLADVLALIQVLALDKHTHRSPEGITKELQGPPRSAADWCGLAGEHPEFFRVNVESDHGLSLAGRHVLPHESNQPRPALSPEFTSVLLQTAITLHDRQRSKADYWKSLLPSIIGMISGILVALITVYISHPASSNRFTSVQGSAGLLLDTSKGRYCWAGPGPKPSLTVSLPDCNTLR
jgi:hypothetical protein